MTKEGYYQKDVIEENLKFYIYQKYKLCPNNCKIIDSFEVKSPFALHSIATPAKIGKQDPDAAYITNGNLGICGECIGKSEYNNPAGRKNDSLAHRNILLHYKSKGINIYLVQKVLVQLLRTFLELQKMRASPIVAYFSGESRIPAGHQTTLDASEIYPALNCLKGETHILNFEKVTDDVCCKQDITIYKIQFPESSDIMNILMLLNDGNEIDIDKI
jgi:hypothetical protein